MNTTTTTTTTTPSTYTFGAYDLDDIGAQGRGYIAVSVHGYWSRDPISIYIERHTPSYRDEATFTWKATMTHSSGGRDENVVVDSLDAESNFGLAMIGAAHFARTLMQVHGAGFELAYQVERMRRDAERCAEAARNEALVALDAPLDLNDAIALVNELEAQAKLKQEMVLRTLFVRGATEPAISVGATITRGGATTYRLHGAAVKRAQLIERLLPFSHRNAPSYVAPQAVAA